MIAGLGGSRNGPGIGVVEQIALWEVAAATDGDAYLHRTTASATESPPTEYNSMPIIAAADNPYATRRRAGRFPLEEAQLSAGGAGRQKRVAIQRRHRLVPAEFFGPDFERRGHQLGHRAAAAVTQAEL
jgi:hypothetical protein